MKLLGILAFAGFAGAANAQCIEEDLIVQHCLTPAEAAYTCQNTGSTDVGLEQVQLCLDSSINQAGLVEDLDRASCIGEQVVSDTPAENVSRCSPRTR